MDWNKRFFLLLGLVSLFRLVYLFTAPLDLSADEAYYWDWSRQLDWGYFSKPPMVAWTIALFTRIMGSSTAVVRLPAVILGSVSALSLFYLARRMYGARTAFWAAAAAMASPGASVLSLIMTIDAPFLCFWSVSLCLLWMILDKGRSRESADCAETDLSTIPSCVSGKEYPWEWCGLAAFIGLGLLSKQTMAAFIGLMFLFILISGDDRRLLKSYKPYLFSLLGFAFLVPTIAWNAHHGWSTFYHTATHFMRGPSNPVATFAEFVGGQIGVISPLTWILFFALSVALLFRFRALDRRALFLLCYSFAPLVGVLVLALRQRVEPNWPAPVYSAAMVLVSAWGCGNISTGSRIDSWRPWFKTGVIVGAVMALITYCLPFWAGMSPGGPAARLAARLQGWKQAGIETGHALGETAKPGNTFLLTFDRQLTAELAFYVPGHPRVYTWRFLGDAPDNQYDLWDGPPVGGDALIVLPEAYPETLISRYFNKVNRLGDVSQGGGSHPRYSLYLGEYLREWPPKKK